MFQTRRSFIYDFEPRSRFPGQCGLHSSRKMKEITKKLIYTCNVKSSKCFTSQNKMYNYLLSQRYRKINCFFIVKAHIKAKLILRVRNQAK